MGEIQVPDPTGIQRPTRGRGSWYIVPVKTGDEITIGVRVEAVEPHRSPVNPRGHRFEHTGSRNTAIFSSSSDGRASMMGNS
jgi:hypothetical protein